MEKFFLLFILFIITPQILCYNNTNLKNVTPEYLEQFDRVQDGYEGCWALYDSGVNSTEICTQFELEYPYRCCRVHYEVGGYKNDYCMPIAYNAEAIGDVVEAFNNADEVDIDCYSEMIIFFKFYILFSFVLLF